MMDPERLLQMYADVPAPGRRKFDRWLNANAILGSVLAAVVFAMAIAGLDAPRHDRTAAKVAGVADWTALRTAEGAYALASPRECSLRVAPYQFPARHPDEAF